MPEFIVFNQHPITNGYLNLNEEVCTEVILNLRNVISFNYNPKYKNGYGDTLSRLLIHTVNGDIELFRKDADFVYNLIKTIGE